MVKIKIKKLQPEAVIPTYAHKGDSGMDVFAINELVLLPMRRALIETGLSFEVPQGYEIQVRPKSGLALKEGISIVNTPGTLDSNFRGELGVILINHSGKPFKVEKGKKIAQIVVSKVETATFNEVKSLSKTMRGSGRFGSTGLYQK
jgi:dUTP pyrophosphatase